MSVWICRSVQLSSLETRQRSYLWVPVTAWRLASLQCAVEQISQGDITCKSGLSTPSDIVHQVFYVHLRLLWWEWAFRALLLYDGTEERERGVWDCACLMVAVAQLHLNCMQLYLFFYFILCKTQIQLPLYLKCAINQLILLWPLSWSFCLLWSFFTI